MEDQLNSPVVVPDKGPDLTGGFMDAYKNALGQEDEPKKQEEAPKEKKAESKPKDIFKDIEALKMPSVSEEKIEQPDPDVPETIKSTKAAEAFKKIKAEREELAKQVDELKKGKSTNPNFESELKQLQEERQILSERLRLLDIERHPDFIKKYETKINSVTESIKGIMGTDGDRLMSLLKTPENDYRNSQIDDIVEGLSPSKRAKLGALIVKYEEINSDRSQELSEAKSDYERIASQYKQEFEDNSKEAIERSNGIWKTISENARALEIFEPRENDDSWNKEISDRMMLAQQIFNGENSEEDLAKAALWAAAAPKYRELLYAQVEVNKRLQAELSKYRKAEPGVETKASGLSGKSSGATNPNSSDFINSFMKTLGR